MRCLYQEQRYDYGAYATVSLYPVFSKGRRRCRKFRATQDAQQALNDANARERLARQLTANYTKKGIFVTLTYEDPFLPTSRRDAIRDFQNFARRLGRAFEKAGEELLYHFVVHGDAGGPRLHFHGVLSADLGLSVLNKLWSRGFVDASPLRFGKTGLMGLAQYMLDGMTWGRVMHTRNVVDPVPRTRTGRVTQMQADMIGSAWDNASYYQGLYPGYKVAAVRPFYNWFNKYFYLRIYLYREGMVDGS